MENPERIVLYDGVCGLCSWSVKFLLKRDRDKRLRYAQLQGETAAEMRVAHPNIPTDLDSVIFVEDGVAHLRSRAFIRIARQLRYPWKALSWFWFIPSPISDLLYRLIARIRYRVWGKRDSCEIPTPEVRARFLP